MDHAQQFIPGALTGSALAARWATPAIYPVRYFAHVGGLMSYGLIPTN
jgi:hypothetical protein